MVKCPQCGSTAQVCLSGIDHIDNCVIVRCNCGCGCCFHLNGKVEIEID